MQTVWLWGILGLVLLALEMASGTFYLMWLGIAALVLSLAVWLIPAMTWPIQCLLFAIVSLVSVMAWKRHYKPPVDLRVGQAQGEEIGRVGTIIEAVQRKQNGRIEFAQGLMGSRVWSAISDEEIPVGSDAVVVSVEGNHLRVRAQL